MLLSYLVCICVYMCVDACTTVHVEVRGQPTGVGFLLPPCGSHLDLPAFCPLFQWGQMFGFWLLLHQSLTAG